MDVDCRKVLIVIGRLCNWDINLTVTKEEALMNALSYQGVSEDLMQLCIKELLKFRHIAQNENRFKLTPKGYDYAYPKRFELYNKED